MKKIISIVILSIFCTNFCSAEPLTPQQALARLYGNKKMAKVSAKIKAVKNPVYTSESYYVFDNNEGGFSILSADDLGPALVGYSDNGDFNIEKIPDGLRYWLEVYDKLMAEAIAQGKPLYSSSTSPRKSERKIIKPLISTKWDQVDPYNRYAPMLTSTQHCVTGCVATALSQILYYYKNPNLPRGKGSWTSAGPKSSGTFDFDTYTPDYSHMRNTYSYGTYTEEEANAVAMLMYAAGAAVKMQYADSSGAFSSDVPAALINNFAFSTAEYHWRDAFTDEEWEEIIYNELANGNPLYYSGQAASKGGHAFICDGYNEEGLYHFNWGWSGAGDGYYEISGIDPLHPVEQGTGGSMLGEGFGYTQAAITNVSYIEEIPPVPVKLEIIADSCLVSKRDASDVEETVFLGTPLKFVFRAGLLCNTTGEKRVFDIGTSFENVETGERTITFTYHAKDLANKEGLPEMNISTSNIKYGTYEVRPVYREANNKRSEWQVAELPESMTNGLEITITKNTETDEKDINNDGEVDNLDVEDLCNYIIEKYEELNDGFDEMKCDINNDGFINIIDLQMLQNYVTNLQKY